MATIREVLTADGMELVLFCGGQSFVGFNLSNTWVGTVAFKASYDGVNFSDLYATPFASGTAVKSVTGNGSWYAQNKGYQAVKAVFTRTSGSATAVISASVDSSYQLAFLASTTIYASQSVSGGAANAITQTAQANRSWRARKVTVGFSVAASAAVLCTITDGASTVLWESYVPPSTNGISGGGSFDIPLPAGSNTPGVLDGGVVGTPGNSMVVTLAAPGGSVVSKVNVEFVPA